MTAYSIQAWQADFTRAFATRTAPNDPPRNFFAFGYLLTEGQMLASCGSDGDLRGWVRNARPGDSYLIPSGERIVCERGVVMEEDQ